MHLFATGEWLGNPAVGFVKRATPFAGVRRLTSRRAFRNRLPATRCAPGSRRKSKHPLGVSVAGAPLPRDCRTAHPWGIRAVNRAATWATARTVVGRLRIGCRFFCDTALMGLVRFMMLGHLARATTAKRQLRGSEYTAILVRTGRRCNPTNRGTERKSQPAAVELACATQYNNRIGREGQLPSDHLHF